MNDIVETEGSRTLIAAVRVQHLPVGTRSRLDRAAVRVRGHARRPPAPIARRDPAPRSRGPASTARRRLRSSRWGELNPPTSVWRTDVSPQHFTCKQQRRTDEPTSGRSSSWGELNPPTSVGAHALADVSPQHFTCLVVSVETGGCGSPSAPERVRRPLRGSRGNRTLVTTD